MEIDVSHFTLSVDPSSFAEILRQPTKPRGWWLESNKDPPQVWQPCDHTLELQIPKLRSLLFGVF